MGQRQSIVPLSHGHFFSLLPSLLQAATKQAANEGVSLDEFVNLAVAERIARLEARTEASQPSQTAIHSHDLAGIASRPFAVPAPKTIGR